MSRLVFVFSLMVYPVFSQANDTLPRRPFKIPQLVGSIIFDGIPDEAAWVNIESLSFHVLEPLWGAPINERTEMKFAFDDQFLYVGGKCFYKDVSKVIRRNFVRDGWRGDDWVAVHIDSRFDHQTAINFAIYPAGSRYDMLISNDAVDLGGSATNPSFNATWDAKSKITSEGWFFEMKIPLFNLRYTLDDDGSVRMGLSVTRWSAHSNELQHSVRIPQGLSAGFLRPSQKQPIVFERLKKSKLLLVSPYVAASSDRKNFYDQGTGQSANEHSRRLTAGLDLKVGVNQRLTLDATLNPDFGQAEADLQQLNLTRFGLYLPERRLFFQEQSGLFDFGLGNTSQLFYSRQIGFSSEGPVPLYGGLRLTGQLGRSLDIGVLNIQSAAKTHSNGISNASENFGVVRLRHKVLNERSFIGLLATNRNSVGSDRYAIGTDALLNVFKSHYVKVGVAASHSRGSIKSAPIGFASTRFSLAWENLQLKGFATGFSYTYSGKAFEPALGFVDRTNFHNLRGELSYGVFASQSKQFFSQLRFGLVTSIYKNATTSTTESGLLGLKWNGYTKAGGSVSANAEYNIEHVSDSLQLQKDVIIRSGTYEFPSFGLLLTPPNAKRISFPIAVGGGGFFGGRRLYVSVSPNINSAKSVHIQPGYDLTYLHFSTGQKYRNSLVHIARLKILFAPNLQFSAAVNIQYNSLERKIFSNVRLRYNFSDGHDLFVVWNNDSRVNQTINGAKLAATEQQMFLMKYTRLFNLGKTIRR